METGRLGTVGSLVLLSLVFVAGCKRGAPPASIAVAGAAAQWALPAEEITFELNSRVDVVPVPVKYVRMTWSKPQAEKERVLYDVTFEDESEEDVRRMETYRYFYSEAGYGILGVLDDTGSLISWDPPEVILPPQPRVGLTWEDDHLRDTARTHRSCELMASKLCTGGLVSVCDARFESEDVQVVRNHFCPGIGFVGFESFTRKLEQPPIRSWTSRVVRDGVKLPDPE